MAVLSTDLWFRTTEMAGKRVGADEGSGWRTPIAVDGLGIVTKISAGNMHSCAILVDKTIKCWGNNVFGQLGNGTVSDWGKNAEPSTVIGISNAVELALGAENSCALLTNGLVSCLGGRSG